METRKDIAMKAYKVNMVNPDKTLVSVCELNPSDISVYDLEFVNLFNI